MIQPGMLVLGLGVNVSLKRAQQSLALIRFGIKGWLIPWNFKAKDF